MELLATIGSDTATAIDDANLRRVLQTEELGGQGDTIRVLADAVRNKDWYVRGHADRVTHYSVLTAESLALAREEREIF
ncbi:MAG: hypothetical protein Q7O66_17885 [Dehalococcoidia bacterium]|nr:hypothetical protein [Dehalococcoidia bacterium]